MCGHLNITGIIQTTKMIIKLLYSNYVDLGDDWEQAIVNDRYELDFLQISFGHSCECYHIGGSTNDITSW